jgi:hypothetical protein
MTTPRRPNQAAIGIIIAVDDAVTRYCAATKAGDMTAMATTLASGAELSSHASPPSP